MEFARVVFIAFVFSLSLVSEAKQIKGESLIFDIPGNINYQSVDGVEGYIFEWKEKQSEIQFYIGRNELGLSMDKLESMADLLVKLQGAVKEEVRIGVFEGFVVKVKETDISGVEQNQWNFTLTTGDTIWGGSLSGAGKKSQRIVNSILENAKKR
ncbi:MAG: hypothetical protein ACPGN3_02235 [Opitutales bacterium]